MACVVYLYNYIHGESSSTLTHTQLRNYIPQYPPLPPLQLTLKDLHTEPYPDHLEILLDGFELADESFYGVQCTKHD